MTQSPAPERKPLKMVECGRCRTKVFLPAGLADFETTPCPRCGHPLIMPVRLRQFELRSVIASGGMGTVFRAFDVNLERQVAVKMVKKDMTGDAEVMAGFYREARVSASLNHTNIIHVYTFDEFDGQPYLAMELADHDSLANWIDRDGRVPELTVLDVGIKVSSALATALRRNLLHRDLKPANILFNEDGEPKLVDFGLAGAEQEGGLGDNIFGTPYYLPPEKYYRIQEDFRSDLYSLGGTLYHAVTGQVPFEAESMDDVCLAHANTPLTPAHLVVPDISQPTSEALSRAMAKDPADRFQSYDDFMMALTAARSHVIVRHLNVTADPEEPPAPGAESGGKSWWRR